MDGAIFILVVLYAMDYLLGNEIELLREIDQMIVDFSGKIFDVRGKKLSKELKYNLYVECRLFLTLYRMHGSLRSNRYPFFFIFLYLF